jgi:hypothetical protein
MKVFSVPKSELLVLADGSCLAWALMKNVSGPIVNLVHRRINLKPGMVVHTCNPNTQETEAGGLS